MYPRARQDSDSGTTRVLLELRSHRSEHLVRAGAAAARSDDEWGVRTSPHSSTPDKHGAAPNRALARDGPSSCLLIS
jgi:hypothetical protein